MLDLTTICCAECSAVAMFLLSCLGLYFDYHNNNKSQRNILANVKSFSCKPNGSDELFLSLIISTSIINL